MDLNSFVMEPRETYTTYDPLFEKSGSLPKAKLKSGEPVGYVKEKDKKGQFNRQAALRRDKTTNGYLQVNEHTHGT